MEKAFHIATQRNATQLAVPIRLEVGRCEEKEKTEMEGGRPGGQGKGKRAGGLSRSPAVLEWFEFLVVLYSIPMVLKRLNEN